MLHLLVLVVALGAPVRDDPATTPSSGSTTKKGPLTPGAYSSESYSLLLECPWNPASLCPGMAPQVTVSKTGASVRFDCNRLGEGFAEVFDLERVEGKFAVGRFHFVCDTKSPHCGELREGPPEATRARLWMDGKALVYSGPERCVFETEEAPPPAPFTFGRYVPFEAVEARRLALVKKVFGAAGCPSAKLAQGPSAPDGDRCLGSDGPR